jgi:Uncharacterised nucleotidyltransferase
MDDETALAPGLRALAVRMLLIDRLTAEIAGGFEAEGIETIVLKGPALAAWLYPGELRPYGDSDLMVAPRDWEGAVALLRRQGFSDHLGPMAHPRMESFASTAFLRGDDNVDLHCALHGLGGDIEAIWETLLAGADRQPIGGRELRILGRPALLLHVALHASHHVEGKPLEDLRRALARAPESQWQAALELAERFDGVQAFASGLRLVPEGLALARRLGVEQDRSVKYDLRREGVPTAEALHDLFGGGHSPGEAIATVARELVPRPAFMRWWTPLARRGPLGLALSYPWRWVWLTLHLPRGLLAVLRARRRGR